MKKINLLLLAILFCYAESSFAQKWEQVSTAPYPFNFTKVFFADGQNGWAGSIKGNIFTTRDGGATWLEQDSHTTGWIRSFYFVDSQNGFAGGDACLLLRTNDGGNIWKVDSISGVDKKASVRAIYFKDLSNGWVLASNSSKGWVLHTTDGGTTWNICLSTSVEMFSMSIRESGVGVVSGKSYDNFYYTTNGINWKSSAKPVVAGLYTRKEINTVKMVNDSVGYAAGFGHNFNVQPSLIFKTIDGGSTWTRIKLPSDIEPYEILYDMYFSDVNNGVIVGGPLLGSVVLKTTDGGNTWSRPDLPMGSSINTIAGVGNKLWIAGNEGLLASSEDGNTWLLGTKVFNATIAAISFPTPMVGYTAGFKGILSKTTDGGNTWTGSYLITEHNSLNLNDIHFIDENIGFAAHAQRMVTKTTDGGKSWKKILPDTSTAAGCYSNGLYFTDENFGVVVGVEGNKYGVIYKTTDGGASWDIRRNVTQGDLLCVKFRNRKYGICVGEELNSLYTKDGGVTWEVSSIGADIPVEKVKDMIPSIKSVAYLNDSIAVAVGEGIILKSNDFGASWQYNPQSPVYTLNSVVFENESVGYACGYSLTAQKANVLMTTDGGDNWENIADTNVVKSSIIALAINKPGNCFVGGVNNNIFHYTGPVTSLVSGDRLPDMKLNLKQNYPNPFNPTTWIEFEVPSDSRIKLAIYDLLGRQVRTLADGVYKKGSYKISFNGSSLSSGIYFYTLQNNNQYISKKMQLLK